ncbi:hypothetical protein RclHR1_11680006 [Rhizophagus clarus]|uniref:F-box domain-containing protein n=1 Tax=Rhizophagus clarus TaxID=94130 RepID=A0A2Z6QK37_9GLOM|nr:hypothetical protein RclHR1_11680006 [Rhizophagus clarus]GES73930.1 hypothetical protein GLOIN_2v1786944 [Rhizophagus clarus]
MDKLNHDCLSLIFETINNDKSSLYPCLLVNRLWCKIAVPILWRNPWEVIIKPFRNLEKIKKARIFFNIVFLHLPEESRVLLKSQNIDKPKRRNSLLSSLLNYLFDKNQKIEILKKPQQKPLFNYISFCKYIRYQLFGQNFYEKVFRHYDNHHIKLLEQEIYKLFTSKCYNIKCLDTNGIKYPLYKFPGAEICFAKLCELYCSSKDDPSLFYGLAKICRFIERFYIYLTTLNSGLAKLIEIQQKVKYLTIKNDINHFIQGNYGDIGSAILKHSHNIIYLSLPIENFSTFYNYFFPEFVNIRKFKLYNQIFDIFDIELHKNFYNYPKLQVLQINLLFSATFYAVDRIIQESGNDLQMILIDFNANIFTGQLLDSISQSCSKLKYLRIDLDDIYLQNFEQVLTNCQSLEGIYIYHYRDGNYLPEIGDNLLKILIKSAPRSLFKIDIGSYNIYKIDSLMDFFKNWVGRKSMWLSSISIYDYDNNVLNQLIEHYKNIGVIEKYKDFCFIDVYNEFKF